MENNKLNSKPNSEDLFGDWDSWKFTCWSCQKIKERHQMANACSCSKIESLDEKWVFFNITEEMIGTRTCPLCICKECDL